LKPQAFIFDAYGTLFDVHSVLRRDGSNISGDLQALSQLWRQKQLEYTWLRALMERYEDFWQITEAALRSVVRQLSIETTDRQLERLMQAYLFPAAFGEVKSALEVLKGSPLAILSNGSPAMLDSAVRNNGLESYFAEIISVDKVKTYKPSPRVLRTWAQDSEPSRSRDSLYFLQLMGRCWSQGVRLPGLLVQPVWSRNGRLGVCS